MRLQIVLIMLGIAFQMISAGVVNKKLPNQKVFLNNKAVSESNSLAIKTSGVGNANSCSVSNAGNANKVTQTNKTKKK
jgi:hypothetical protein